MQTLWIGDVRTEQIQLCEFQPVIDSDDDQETSTEQSVEESEHKYLIESFADYSWFENNAIKQLPFFAYDNYNIIIMLGFIDCVHSCAWQKESDEDENDPYAIGTIAKNYISTIKSLVETYPGFLFFVCSVAPVTEDYPFAFYKDTGIIPKKDLNDKITYFNEKLTNAFSKEIQQEINSKEINADKDPEDEKTSGKDFEDIVTIGTVNFIDCHKYLSTTSFETRNNIYFTKKSCEDLYNYIVSHCFFNVAASTTKLIEPRIEKGDAPRPGDESWHNWTRGYNECIEIPVGSGSGVVIPNCTGYAWGRFMEIAGEKPTLSTGNAGTWWDCTTDGYTRGQDPKVGAVICWKKAGHAGHVGIVESVDTATNTIITSESGYRNTYYDPDLHFHVCTRKNLDGNWGLGGSGYHFQGFIYNPGTAPSSTGTLDSTTGTVQMPSGVSKTDVISEDRYLTQSEMEINARYIWSYLGAKGWSLNAVAGMLGNMQHESTINPGRGEVGGSGFGLVQWTPKSNLTNWTRSKGYEDNDIDGQLERIIYEKDNGGQYIKRNYKYTFEEFMVSTDDPYTLACAFAFDYERSWIALYGTSSEKEALRKKRGSSAEAWYQYLYTYAPGTTFSSKFIAENFKINKLTSTTVKVSFITSSAKSAEYAIKTSKEDLITKDLEIPENSENVKIVTFEYNELKPNTEYKLFIKVVSSLGENTRTFETTFKTPQSLPNSVTNLKIKSLSTKLLEKELKVTFEAPASWGYWKNNTHGYEIYLIVNGKTIATKTVNELSNEFTLIPDKYFTGYTSKLGDTIQIGIKTWVTDNKTKIEIYDSEYITTSNPICLLNRPFKTYLKV